MILNAFNSILSTDIPRFTGKCLKPVYAPTSPRDLDVPPIVGMCDDVAEYVSTDYDGEPSHLTWCAFHREADHGTDWVAINYVSE